MNKFVTLFCTVLFIQFYGLKSQELPPIIAFSTDNYAAANQNWSITQNDNKFIYVANNDGLLRYDGAEWQLHPSPNQTILRSVRAVGDRIYSGAFMDFGYWDKTPTGDLTYTSLVKANDIIPVEDEQIWTILNLDKWIVFQSFHNIYIFDPQKNEIRTLPVSNSIFKSFMLSDNSMCFQSLNEGLFTLKEGQVTLLSDHGFFKNKPLINVYPSTTNASEYILHTQQNMFYSWNAGTNLISEHKNLNENILRNTTAYSSIRLKNGNYVIGTISNGLQIIDGNGNLIHHIGQSEGLTNNTVLTAFEDKDANIWLGLDNGINCINQSSAIKIFNDKDGMLGTVYAAAFFKGKLYLGTNQGLFFKEEQEQKFKFIEGTEGQVWNLKIIDETLFCGHNNGTFTVNDGWAQQISNIPGTWSIKALGEDEKRLIQGNYDGLYVLIKENDSWQLSHKIEGFTNSSRYFEVKGHHIIVSHEYKGLFHLLVNEEFTNVLDVNVVHNKRNKNAGLIAYNKRILYAAKEGVFEYDFENKSLQKNSEFSTLYRGDEYLSGKLIYHKDDDKLWAFSKKGLSYLSSGKFSDQPEVKVIPFPELLSNTMEGFENLLRVNKHTYLLGTSTGYVLIDLNKLKFSPQELRLHKISASTKSEEVRALKINENEVLSHQFNSLNFGYSIPQFNVFEKPMYQYKLLGYNENWSQWSFNPTAQFKNLPAGDYDFTARARIGNKIVNLEDSYKITIKKIWYVSNVATVLYILLGAFGIFFFNNYYHAYYRKQREQSLQKVQNELALKDLESNKHLIELENQKLVQDIENKNKELAISTMSLVKKNEFLNKIKKELLKKAENSKVQEVIHIIDKNINSNDDWKFFQQAFNNADKEFLDKVKTKHPTLTPNDLKLCAYLRLNLSSKEIAPLLNISPRSVEVKRYRLRKKMELEHNIGLTNYILEI